MKNNWGTYIAIVYTLFASIMIFMLLRSCGISSPLIEENYYSKELQFDDLRSFEENVRLKNRKPEFSIENDNVVWVFDKNFNRGAKGTLVYKHLKEPNYDKDITFSFDSLTTLTTPLNSFNKGMYQVEIFWYLNTDTFYNQQGIEI
jgi:nitrogen fixation protein FixH